MRSVLITGIEGFTGRYLAKQMAACGYMVSGTSRSAAASLDNGITVMPCDLTEADPICQIVADLRPEVIVHLAGISSVAHGNASEIYSTNILGSRNLLEAACSSSSRPTRILMASSANVYGNSSGRALDECAIVAPTNDYAVSKLAMEFLAKTYSDRLSVTIVRPFNYTGVGQSTSFLVPKLVHAARLGQGRLKMGNIDVCRDFSDVRSVVEAYVRLLEVPEAAGQIVNVCTGEAYSVRQILSFLTEMTGLEWQIDVDENLVRKNEVKILKGDNRKITRLIGGLDRPSLRETLHWMLNSEI